MDNFIVSARKYRPATFKSVVGQSHITSTLKNAIARNQLAHAYLFCGPRGVGKTTCARIFAKAINCQNPQDHEACGECESCLSFNEGRSMNIHELDAASNNSVDDIRNLIDQVRVLPQTGKYSVYIIDEVHMLSPAAFNAFLKTLEEPPAHAIFILATTEKYKILPTILSRCQIFDFNRIRVEDAVGYLKYIASQEGVTYDDESLHLIAQKADGGMRDALSMFDKAVSFCGNALNFKDVAATLNVLDYDTYFKMTETISLGDYKRCLVSFDEVLKKGFSGQTFLAGLNNHFRDLLMCKDAQTLPLLEMTGSLLERYKQQGTVMDTSFLFSAISLLSATDTSLKAATNQRLHIELALMKLCGLGQKKNDFADEPVALPELHKEMKASDLNASTSPQPAPTASNIASSAPQSATVSEAKPDVATDEKKETVPPSEVRTARPSADVSSVQQPQAPPQPRLSQQPCPAEMSATTPPEALKQQPKTEEAGNAPLSQGKSVFGMSLKELIADTATPVKKETEPKEAPLSQSIDPESEKKILGVKEQFLNELNAVRPRIANALQNMTVSGNRICATLCSDLIYEEVMTHRQEILGVLYRLVKIDGLVEFDLTVKEADTRVNPITIEEKYAYLKTKNPMLTELQKRLHLELE